MRGRSEAVRAKMAEESMIRTTEQVVMVLGTMKGVAMKLGQMMSVLDLDLVPEDHRERFQKRLAVLRNAAPTVSFDAMRQVVEEDFGQPLTAIFAEFDPEPIAAASIGQVYRATLRDGRVVAVKVQYPGIDAAVRADLKNLNMFRKVLTSAMPWVTPAVLDELRLNMEGELDYQNEAVTQLQIAELYAGHPFIAVPRSLPELSTTRVLVSEYLPGKGFEELRQFPRTSATGSARSSTGSTSARCSPSTSSAATRTPAMCCSSTTAASASSTSACSTGWIPSTCGSRRSACARPPRTARRTCAS